MKHYYDVCIGPKNLGLPNVTITVYVAGTGQTVLASIFSDDGVTAKANPFLSDALGNLDFYVADGRYDVQFSGAGIATRLETDIEISDITQGAAGDAAWVITPLGVLKWDADTGLSRFGAGLVAVGNGAQGDSSGSVFLTAAFLSSLARISNLGVYQISSTASSNGVADTGISRTGAKVIGVGNGAQGDTTGFLEAQGISANRATSTGLDASFSFAKVQTGSAGVFAWGVTNANTAADTGISRAGAKTVAFGGGTQGDDSGVLLASHYIGQATFAPILRGGAGASFDLEIRNTTETRSLLLVPDSGGVQIGGATSGFTIIIPAAIASGTLTLPAATDTLVGKATTDIFTNKTFDTAGTGNVLKINGTQVSAVTGTGSAVLATAPSLTSVAIGGTGLSVTAGGIAVSPVVQFNGSVSGNTQVQAASAASGLLTLPAATDTLVAAAAGQTLTNKRVSPRNVAVADATSITPNSDTSDIVTQVNTQVAGTLTLNAPTGTPTDGQKLQIRIKATNAQTYSFNAAYHFGSTVPAPTTLAAGKTDYIGCMWNATNTSWDVVAVSQGY